MQRKSVLTNLHNANTIGILYDSTNPDNDIVITKFAEGLRGQGKTVEILGFVDDKKIDHKADIQIFNSKSLNWIRVPADEKATKFAGQNFDLLFAAFTVENKPLEYIARTSQSGWRVGSYDEKKTDFYDLMINVGDKKELPYFLEQATYFLNKIQYDSK